jgi:hypothetical protein
MKAVQNFSVVLLMAISCLFFSSFSVVPASTTSTDGVGHKSSVKKEEKQQAKVAKLEAKIEKATSAKQKARLEAKLAKTKAPKEENILSILALVFAFIFPVVGLILAIIAKKKEGTQLAQIAFILSLVFLILGVLFIILYIALFAAAFAVI